MDLLLCQEGLGTLNLSNCSRVKLSSPEDGSESSGNVYIVWIYGLWTVTTTLSQGRYVVQIRADMVSSGSRHRCDRATAMMTDVKKYSYLHDDGVAAARDDARSIL